MSALIRLPTVAFDESGNTGQHLLDPAQLVFVHASVCLPNDAATDLVRNALQGSDSRELKFGRLRRSAHGHQRLLTLLNDQIMNPDNIKVSCIDKSFMVTIKMMDMLVEPGMMAARLNFYERGHHLSLTNLWHAIIPTFLGRDVFNRLQELFVKMVRSRSRDDLDEFYRLVHFLFATAPSEDVQGLLAMVLNSHIEADAERTHWDQLQLDPAIPSFWMLAALWTAQLDTPFVVVHDESKPISFGKERLLSLTDWERPATVIIHNGRKLAIPPRVADLRLVNSENYPEVQLADTVASALAYTYRSGEGDEQGLTKALRGTRAFQSIVYPLEPELHRFGVQRTDGEDTAGFDPLTRIVGVMDLRSAH